MVCAIAFNLANGLSAIGFSALAQQRDPSDAVRARSQAERQVLAPYWEGFIARAQGNCRDAVTSLEPIAQSGRGFEDAQAVFGICTMINAGYRGAETSEVGDLKNRAAFIDGRNWVLKAARAGQAEAQAELVQLYLIEAGPDQDPAEGAKWAHLYLTNPLRLSLGIENKIEARIETMKEKIDPELWLEGKERARKWFPVFDQVKSPKELGRTDRPDHTQPGGRTPRSE